MREACDDRPLAFPAISAKISNKSFFLLCRLIFLLFFMSLTWNIFSVPSLLIILDAHKNFFFNRNRHYRQTQQFMVRAKSNSLEIKMHGKQSPSTSDAFRLRQCSLNVCSNTNQCQNGNKEQYTKSIFSRNPTAVQRSRSRTPVFLIWYFYQINFSSKQIIVFAIYGASLHKKWCIELGSMSLFHTLE